MRIERLGGHHELGTFHCGVKSLDDWLAVHALDNQRRNLSRSFLLVDDTDEVLGYYSLTMGGVHRDDLPRRYGRGLPDYDIAMVLLARLAVTEHRQGEGLGRDLLIEAIERAALAGEHAAARFIAVDPINSDAAAFYREFGFVAVPGDEAGRMFIRIDTANASLDRGRSGRPESV